MALDMADMLLQEIAALADLDDETCGLKHSKEDPSENHPAVDYLCHMMGITTKDGEEISDAQLRIPVCQECVDALLDNEWILFYCVYCGESQWLLKRLAKNGYSEDTKIIAFKACPNCYTKQMV
jgi:hypothetical protein